MRLIISFGGWRRLIRPTVLTEDEVDFMVSQNAIPSKQYLSGPLPYVFAEQGVATISAVLTSGRAIEVNIQIMRAFVAMRRFIHFGASLKDLGKKWFAFFRMDIGAVKMLENLKKVSANINA